jgi:hypothetical protein
MLTTGRRTHWTGRRQKRRLIGWRVSMPTFGDAAPRKPVCAKWLAEALPPSRRDSIGRQCIFVGDSAGQGKVYPRSGNGSSILGRAAGRCPTAYGFAAGLANQGTYWYLDTRREEAAEIAPTNELTRGIARWADRINDWLKACPHQTMLHGMLHACDGNLRETDCHVGRHLHSALLWPSLGQFTAHIEMIDHSDPTSDRQ